MAFRKSYMPPQLGIWQGSANAPDRSLFFQIVSMFNLLEQNHSIEQGRTTFAIIGFNCDEGIRRNQGRVGAAKGPDAIRLALAQLPVQKRNYQLFDAGNIVCIDGNLEEAQLALGEAVAILFEKNMVPIVLGGGHEVAWGHYQGIAQAFPDKNLGIINFDSHFDLIPVQPNTGGNSHTSFLQIAQAQKATKHRFDYNCVGIQHSGSITEFYEIAKKNDVKVIWADELHLGQLEKCADFIDRIIDQNELIYLSLCLDVFSCAFAPGVSDTQPLGLLPWHVIPLIRQLTASAKVISFEVSELSPRHDIDQSTAKLAASLIYEFIHHYSEQRRSW